WQLPQNLPVKPGSQLTLVVSDDTTVPSAGARVIGASVTPFGPAPLPTAMNVVVRHTEETRIRETLQLIGSIHVTHLATHRPMYRPGETVRFRSLTLERFNLKPVSEDFQLRYTVTDPRGAKVFELEGLSRVKGADGKQILGPDGQPLRGLGTGEFKIPADAAGGEYTLRVADAQDRFPAETRKVLVNKYQAPRLNKELEFDRKAYGPGDSVVANCKVARAEGGTVANGEPVFVQASVDGVDCDVLDRGALRVIDGKVTVRLRLPKKIERGFGSLTVTFNDGGITEPIVRPIPIVLKKLFVEFFPEGGDLIASVPNRVYFTAKTTLGKPAELQGRLVDNTGKVVTAVRTLNDDEEAGVNQGMGRFEFTPQAGRTYEVKVDAPIGIESKHVLPESKADGVVLAV